jgi:hypothetical protein
MTGVWHRSVVGRRWFAAFVVLALLVQILVPQGFMLAPDASGASILYICSGHGPVGALDDHGKPAKAPKPNGDTPCNFAGHGVSTPPPSAISVGATLLPITAIPVVLAFEVSPGLGLAAPPPPSHAPPALI